LGRVSGWGWGLGYFGGLFCLALTLAGLVQPETPWFGLEKETAEHVRAAALVVAIWYAIFSIPLFLFTPDKTASDISFVNAIKKGLRELRATFSQVRQHSNMVKFLIARMIYTDGLNTLYAFGGIYAAGSFGMELNEIIIFGIGINVTAGLGAVAFGWVDDWIGPKKTVMIALAGLSVLGTALLIVETKTGFWAFGLPLGFFVGPAQAASRSMMARLAPPELTTEMFGLYAFSGKATAFLGPALLGVATLTFDSQRAGMATILVFFALGMVLLKDVGEPTGKS
jgi:UMF1 family MFS transporter